MGKLKSYRKKIDIIDKKIVKLLMSRFELARQISIYKKWNKLEIIDKKRERQVINNIKKFSNKHKKFVIGIFKNIITYSKKLQK
ncbi:chorismate mutase [Candidatus Woesearchaeota archaeon]|nr:chorismate mutase [Candidatus Woesearchaeota archaeon]